MHGRFTRSSSVDELAQSCGASSGAGDNPAQKNLHVVLHVHDLGDSLDVLLEVQGVELGPSRLTLADDIDGLIQLALLVAEHCAPQHSPSSGGVRVRVALVVAFLQDDQCSLAICVDGQEPDRAPVNITSAAVDELMLILEQLIQLMTARLGLSNTGHRS